MGINCCNGCVPPKRTPTCKFDGTCDKYAIAKAKYDMVKAEADRKKAVIGGITAQVLRRVDRANKARNHQKGR